VVPHQAVSKVVKRRSPAYGVGREAYLRAASPLRGNEAAGGRVIPGAPVAVPPDHDIARAPVGFIRPLVDRVGATLLYTLLRSVDETGSAMSGLKSDELT